MVATLLGAALALGVPTPALALPLSSPTTSAVVDEAALASWILPARDGGRDRWLFAGVFRDETAGGGTRTFAFVVKGTCRAVHDGHRHATSCRGRGTGGRVPAARFHLDPALRAARLVLHEKGRVAHEVVWKAASRSVPYGYVAAEACPDGDGEGGGMQRAALARGRVSGRKVAHAAVDYAVLARGAMVTECGESVPPRVLRRAAAGKAVGVVFPR